MKKKVSATVAGTIVLGQFEGTQVSVEADYNDNLKLTTLRVANGSTEHGAGVILYRTVTDGEGNTIRDGVQYGLECPAAAQEGDVSRATLEIPAGNQGITLTPSSHAGRYNGYEADMRFPW